MPFNGKSVTYTVVIHSHDSLPHAALAFVIKDGSTPTVLQVGDTTSTHVEAGLVVWVGVHAIRFATAEWRTWNAGGGSGSSTRLWCGGRGQWGQLWLVGEQEWVSTLNSSYSLECIIYSSELQKGEGQPFISLNMVL